MVVIFSSVRPDTPASAPILSRVFPRSLVESFPECLRPGAVPPCSRCRFFAAVRTCASMARQTTASSLVENPCGKDLFYLEAQRE